MTNINWDLLFYFDPATGESTSDPTAGIGFPTYGNYGGGGYSAGQFGGDLLTRSDGSAYSYKQLVKFGDDLQDPADQLDYLFYQHDVASAQAGTGYTQAQAYADISLLKSLVKLDASYDPEASLYAGFASLAMIGELAIHNDLNLISPKLLLAGLTDAANDIQYGLQNLDATELATVLGSVFEPVSDHVFSFDFTITTSTLAEEGVEFLVMNALNKALDSGESDDAPINTGFLPGPTEYHLTYDTLTHDLDLV
jgi:hypothetical protein